MSSKTIEQFFDRFALIRDRWRPRGYHSLLLRYYQFYIPPGSKVLEVGCGTGDLLADLKPSFGVGIDLSKGMVEQAQKRHTSSHLRFYQQHAEALSLDAGTFDYIVISDTLTFVEDVRAALNALRPYCHARTRILFNFFSHLWKPLLAILSQLKLRYPQPHPNWLTVEDVRNLLSITGYETVTTDSRIVFPARIPVLDSLFNRWLMLVPGYRHLSLTNFVVARLPMALETDSNDNKSPAASATGVSVVCPCRNEQGNIELIAQRLPTFAVPSELIFVEGNSRDGTFAECQRVQSVYSDREITVLEQTGKGKGDAVRLGFQHAKYSILVILDADMTVAPEDLPGFVETLMSGRAEFVNGSRLVYPMQDEAMRFLNLFGNKFFAVMFTWLLGQTIKDTLCGTKVLLKSDYDRLAAQRDYFGTLDPFGDFDLIFGATKLGLQLRDYPIRYRARTYGETQISRFRHGMLLLRMCALAITKLKWR
jgi:SAM-dependent methyltransferase